MHPAGQTTTNPPRFAGAIKENVMERAIEEINNINFFRYDWYLGNDKLVAIHRPDKSTKHMIMTGKTLCSLRTKKGKGDQYKALLDNNTSLTTTKP